MKRNNINKWIMISATLLLCNTGCKKYMTQLNTKPTTVQDADPVEWFAGATLDINYNARHKVQNRYTFLTYMQYIVPDGENADLKANYWLPGATSGGDPNLTDRYNDYYTGVGVNMNRILKRISIMPDADKQKYTVLSAMCKIIDVYHAWQVVDVFGALPYSQAFDDVNYPLPEYDLSNTLYKTFDIKLKEAATMLANAPGNQADMSLHDFFYNGNSENWLKFANILRIKIAQRFEKRDPSNLTNVIQDIENTFSNKVFTSNMDSFGENQSRDWNNNVDDINSIITSFNAGYAFVEFLKSTNDPRLKVLIRENQLGDNNKQYAEFLALTGDNIATPETRTKLSTPEYKTRYYGKHSFPGSQTAQYGPTGAGRFQNFSGTTSAISLSYQSQIQGRYFVKNGGFKNESDRLLNTNETVVNGSTLPYRVLYLTYGEQCFMLSEIALKRGGNVLGKDATSWYNEGVKASFDQYKTVGISIKVPYAEELDMGDYLNRYPFNGTLERIYSQAWVHFFNQPEEAWAMWKRTGFPQFKPFEAGQPSQIGDGSGNAYLESLKDGNNTLTIPRRGILPGNTQYNIKNMVKARQDMLTLDPNYLQQDNDTKGRIWWDVQ